MPAFQEIIAAVTARGGEVTPGICGSIWVDRHE